MENDDPCWAIMCRADLYTENKRGSGGIDTKIANLAMMQNVYPIIQAGPTHDNLPVFQWTQLPNVSHIALPPQYDFDWIIVPSVL